MFCLEHGWNIKFDAKGHLQMKEEMVEGEGKVIPSWLTHHTFWNREYKDLVIPHLSEDICGEFWCFANSFHTCHEQMECLKHRLDDETIPDS